MVKEKKSSRNTPTYSQSLCTEYVPLLCVVHTWYDACMCLDGPRGFESPTFCFTKHVAGTEWGLLAMPECQMPNKISPRVEEWW